MGTTHFAWHENTPNSWLNCNCEKKLARLIVNSGLNIRGLLVTSIHLSLLTDLITVIVSPLETSSSTLSNRSCFPSNPELIPPIKRGYKSHRGWFFGSVSCSSRFRATDLPAGEGCGKRHCSWKHFASNQKSTIFLIHQIFHVNNPHAPYNCHHRILGHHPSIL